MRPKLTKAIKLVKAQGAKDPLQAGKTKHLAAMEFYATGIEKENIALLQELKDLAEEDTLKELIQVRFKLASAKKEIAQLKFSERSSEMILEEANDKLLDHQEFEDYIAISEPSIYKKAINKLERD